MTRATITSWKTLALPEQREPLGFAADFSAAEMDLLVLGVIPREMEDKWFICLHQGWLLFYRSWTGTCIYGLRLEAVRGGARVVDSWVSRDAAQYKGTDVEYDRRLVRFLIDAFLFHRAAIFPMPAGAGSAPPGAYQHSVVGRAYPESPPEPASEIPAQSQAK